MPAGKLNKEDFENETEKSHKNCKHYKGDVVLAHKDYDFENPCLRCWNYDLWEGRK